VITTLTPSPAKRRFLKQGVLTLIARRARASGHSETGFAWVPDDPLVGWLAPILYDLREGGYIKLPREVERRCLRAYTTNHERWSTWRDRLYILQEELRRAVIPVLPLKGAAYIEQIYSDEGLRPLKDVDILIPQRRFVDAIRTMLDEGLVFQSTGIAQSLESFFNARPGEWPASILLRDPATHLFLKMRSQLLSSDWFYRGFSLDPNQIWSRKVANPQRDSLWPYFLSPYDTLAHLCIYQANHNLEMLIAYVDTDIWIRKRSVSWDWGEFVRTVNQWQIRSAAYHTLSYCQALMETPLPPDLLKQLDPGTSARQRVSWLMSPGAVLNPAKRSKLYSPGLVKLALVDRFQVWLKLAARLLFPEKGWLVRRYGRPISLRQHWRALLAIARRKD
jgi:hypothetical protein